MAWCPAGVVLLAIWQHVFLLEAYAAFFRKDNAVFGVRMLLFY